MVYKTHPIPEAVYRYIDYVNFSDSFSDESISLKISENRSEFFLTVLKISNFSDNSFEFVVHFALFRKS